MDKPTHDIHPADLPEDLAAEMLAVTREAARIARVGGTSAERMALARRRDAVLRSIEFDEAKRELQSVEAARAAYCREHTHCMSWPLCGHTDPEEGNDE